MKDVHGIISEFDEYQGHKIQKLSLTNANGVTLSLLTLGSTIYEIKVPSKKGTHNIVLNYYHSKDYLANPFYVCMAIGRTAGRIMNGQIVLDGQTTQLPQNEGTTTLHGGPTGFNSQIWRGKIISTAEGDAIEMSHLQKDDGYPGELQVKIIYTLSSDDIVGIKYNATSTADTVFNPTQHVYFNLGIDDTITRQVLKVNAAQIQELDNNKIPTGKQISVGHTPFDFQQPTSLGKAIAGMSDTAEKGFDDIFAVKPDDDNLIAKLVDPETDTSVGIESDRNGLVMFTANSFTKDEMNLIRTNGVGQPYEGIALEPQTLAKAGSARDFSAIELKKGEEKSYIIKYHLRYEK
ncbi:aldose epimerase family protein [Lactobacillus sp. ESL0677]|uniref:aldose epimerase family protein n=1 Tax=Lactobacillus sp. ESL0677 TaxID=2983208 RepID=UPI0023F706D4|nr:aldose epimerase family protein [Lactobacillus sp. ESL0677]WEV36870.1 galactose mutarotase [Lactobacillus sp. ESL0677]